MTMQVHSDIGVLQANKKFKDKVCWLVGSGPSLDEVDLSKIKDQTIFAVNAAITLFSEAKFRDAWWIFRDRRIVHQLGKRLDKWGLWRVITHKSGFMTVKDVCGHTGKRMVVYLYNKDAIIHRRTIIEDALQILQLLGFKQVNLVGIDHAVVENRPYAKALSWKECFFYNPKTPPISGKSIALGSMMDAMEQIKPSLGKMKVINTSPYYPKPIFEHVEFADLV